MKPIATAFLLALLVLASPANAQTASVVPIEELEEIVVVGRQPGPPLWRIGNGEHVLWLFPLLSPVPRGMIWEPNKVAAVLADADELLEAPNLTVAAARPLLLNPVNVWRGLRLAKRLSRNPDEATLQDVLPPDVYARYAVLKEKYFPRDMDIERLRPSVVSGLMVGIIQEREGLTSDAEISRALRRLIRRNRGIKRTPIEIELEIEGGYREVAGRFETLVASLDRAAELDCFESTLWQMEHDLESRKARANAWAQGRIDEFRALPLPGSDEDPCFMLLSGSSEGDDLAAARARLDRLWLEEAERALRDNRTTFGIMSIVDLLRPEGPIAQLREKGYQVAEP